MAEEEKGRKICISSGKGGVGKSLITLNLGLSIGKTGEDVIILDADIDMANLEMMLGMQGRPITLQDVMRNQANIQDAIYEIPGEEARFVPAGISPTQFRRMDPDKLKRVVDKLAEQCDILLIDSPAGVGKDTIACFNAVDEVFLVVTPETISAADASKTKKVAEKMGAEIKGIILNRLHEKRYGMNDKEITTLLNAQILTKIEEEPEIRKAIKEEEPVIAHLPESQFTKKIKELTQKITGKTYTEEIEKGIMDKIKSIFSR